MAVLIAGGGRPGRRGFAQVLALLALLASSPAWAQSPYAADGNIDFQKITGPAASSLPLADTLEQTGRRDEALLLRRYLLHRHVDDLLGVQSTGTLTVRDAINKAAFELGNPVTDKALAARWQQAFNRHVSVRPNTGGYLPAPWRALNPAPQEVAPGAWLAVQPDGTRHLVAVFLFNQSPTALPFMPLGLELGGLAFACRPGPDNNPDSTEPVLSRNDRFLICEASAAPGSKKPGVRALSASAPQPPAWLWRPAHLESDASVQALLAAIGLDAQEHQRALAQQRLKASAQTPSPAPPPEPALASPQAQPPPPPLSTSPLPPASVGLKSAWPLAVGCVVILVLAYLGKALRRRGWSSSAIDIVTLASALLVMLPFAALILKGQGSDSATRFVLYLFVLGPLVFGGAVILTVLAKGLRKVLELLENAGLGFPEALGDALRRSLDFTGTASPAQFWSVFMVYGVLAVVTVAVQTSVASWVVLAVLSLPMTALTVRRLLAMTWIEVLTLCAVGLYIAADIFVF